MPPACRHLSRFRTIHFRNRELPWRTTPARRRGRCAPSSSCRPARASPPIGWPAARRVRRGPPGATSASCARPASRSTSTRGPLRRLPAWPRPAAAAVTFSATEALGLVMAVLDGHHDAGDPDHLGRRRAGQDRAGAAGAGRRAGRGRPPDRAPAPDPAAARPDPARPGRRARPAPTTGGEARLPLRGRAGVGHRGRPVGGRRPPRPVVPAVPIAPGARPSGATGSTASAASMPGDETFEPPAGLDPGRGGRRPPRRRLGARRRSRHRRAPRPGRPVPAARGREARARRRRDDPADRQHQQPSVVRRAARPAPGAVPDRPLRRTPAGRERPRARLLAAAGKR